MKEDVYRDVKTEKAQEQDGFGNKMKYHFHISTVHKYHFFVFCLYYSCVYLSRVVMWKWYFILLPKPFCSCAFSVLMSLHLLSFLLKMFYLLFLFPFFFFLNGNEYFLYIAEILV